jgi:hypothetical protein
MLAQQSGKAIEEIADQTAAVRETCAAAVERFPRHVRSA